eukprot:m51a1_g10074 hypothetical protein (443) ;mRNA; r:29796-31236
MLLLSLVLLPARAALWAAAVATRPVAGLRDELLRAAFTCATCALLGVCVVFATLRDVSQRFRRDESAPSGETEDGAVAVPRASVSVAAMVRQAGLQCEEHEVKTADGHVLVCHRVYEGPVPRGQPVILQHGLLQRAGVYVTGTGTTSFAQTLAHAGFDVWLGNTRGTFPGRSAQGPSAASDAYWSWGLTELGTQDFPAIVSYVARATAAKPVYVGHSQGSAMALIGLGARPELAQQLRSLVLLAPAFFVSKPRGSCAVDLLAAAGTPTLEALFGRRAFLGVMNVVQALAPASLFMYLGSRMFSYLFNWHYALWRPEHMAASFQFTPAPVSTRLIAQWMASLRRGCVCRVAADGSDGEAFAVPSIDARCPVDVVWGLKDDICDGGRLARELRARGCAVSELCVKEYAHLDLIWAWDANRRVLGPVQEFIGSPSKQQRQQQQLV